MLSTEPDVLSNSDYYIHTPSVQAKRAFFIQRLPVSFVITALIIFIEIIMIVFF